jgi:hypothetical protein
LLPYNVISLTGFFVKEKIDFVVITI